MRAQKRPLHIVFLDLDDIQNHLLNGGQARATYEVAKRLVKLGNKVTIVSSKFPGYKDRFTDGIYYTHIGFTTSNIRINNVIFFLSLPFAVSKLKADAIIECFMAPISISFAPLFTKIPVIGMPTMFEAEEFAKKYHLPFHWVEAMGCKFYKYFLAYSPRNKQKMERLNPKIHTRIIPNGVSEEMFDVKTKVGNYAFFIGRIDIVQKGLDLLLESMQKIKKTNPIKLIIAGNGPKDEENKLKKMIASMKLSNKVSFVGRVDGKKKEKFIAECSFGIYSSRFEDFPLVPLEFAAMNKPLVCFDIPGLAWVPEKAAIKAKSFEVDSLTQAIEKVSTDKNYYKSLAKAAQPFARKYGWNEIAKEYESFCHEVIAYEKSKK